MKYIAVLAISALAVLASYSSAAPPPNPLFLSGTGTAPVVGDCVKLSSTRPPVAVTDAGAPCGGALSPIAASTVLCNPTSGSAVPVACTAGTGISIADGSISATSAVQNSGTLSKSGSTLEASQFGLLQQMTLSGTPTSISNAYTNYLSVTDQMDSTSSTDTGQAGGLRIDYTMTGSTKGGREPLAVLLQASAESLDAGVTNRNYVGITSYVDTYSEGGSAGEGDAMGQWYGWNCNAQTPATASYVSVMTCQENDISNRSTTLAHKIGIDVIQSSTDTNQGVYDDVAIGIAGQQSIASGSPGWECGLCFGLNNGYWDMADDDTSSLISAYANSGALGANVGAVGYVINLPDITVNTAEIALPGWTTNGTGDFAIAGVGASAPSWTTRGIQFQTGASTVPTYTDTTSSGTITTEGLVSLNAAKIAASNATTISDMCTLCIGQAPTAGTNVTATRSDAIYVGAGQTTLNGKLLVQAAFTQNSGAFVLSGGGASSIDAGSSNALQIGQSSTGLMTLGNASGKMQLDGKVTLSVSGGGTAADYVCTDSSDNLVVQTSAC